MNKSVNAFIREKHYVDQGLETFLAKGAMKPAYF